MSSSSPPSSQRRPSIPIQTPSPLSAVPATPSTAATITPPQLPVPRRSSTPTTPPGNKTRARDLLRKHYGLGIGPPPPLSGRAKAEDPMDMDSSAFDTKAYYEQLITTSSLPALLKRENELLSEIKILVGDRQSLVYNHHHELIAASDTIASMKSRAESLDADLDLLKVAFSEISRLGTEVVTENDANEPEARSFAHWHE